MGGSSSAEPSVGSGYRSGRVSARWDGVRDDRLGGGGQVWGDHVLLAELKTGRLPPSMPLMRYGSRRWLTCRPKLYRVGLLPGLHRVEERCRTNYQRAEQRTLYNANGRCGENGGLPCSEPRSG